MIKAKGMILALPAAILAASAGTAQAHVGHGSTMGFSTGFLHPIFGLDHLLAMVMVGAFAVQLGGRAIALVPGAFLAAMVRGGVLGVSQVSLGGVELAIALSVFSLGVAVACRINPALPAAMAIVAFFGVFHGHAHGNEMPEVAAGLAYGAGFLLSTAILHGSGVAIGLSIGELKGRLANAVLRFIGAAVAMAGGGMIAGAV